MNVYKKQSIQKLVIDQAGTQRLILNDLILGREGAQLIAHLIPQYHPDLLHLQIKGNNIDDVGFEAIFLSLTHCAGLVSIQAEWNNIGGDGIGLTALGHMLNVCNFVELIDLKNNKINHTHSGIIAQIIAMNHRSLKVIDLRWNDLGQVGAQNIYPALIHNTHLQGLPLEDNRISHNTLTQIAQVVANPHRSIAPPPIPTKTSPAEVFPISEGNYASMEDQTKAAQVRGKIQNQQKQAVLQQEALQVQIQKVLQKIRIRGVHIHEAQTKLDMLEKEAVHLTNQLREGERLVSMEKDRAMGVEVNLNQEMSALRTQKYHSGTKIQVMMEKVSQRQQREVQDLGSVMEQKYQRLQAYLQERLGEKRASRQKLVETRQDTLRFKLGKQSLWDKLTTTTANPSSVGHLEQVRHLQQAIANTQALVNTQRKKGEYLSEELTNFVMKGLARQQKLQKQIFELQSNIKRLHRQMTLANVDMQSRGCNIALKQAQTIEKEAQADLSRRYIRYIQSQSSVNLDIERLKGEQDRKADRLGEEGIEMRIVECEKALRQEQAQNRMIKNHYEKMAVQLEVMSKNSIQAVLFNQ